MHLYQLHHFGLDGFRPTTAPVPTPASGEVLVRWHAWSLNYRDLVILEGTYLPHLPLPATLLSDAAGEVIACGAGVTHWRPGDRVVSHYLPDWQDGAPTAPKLRAALGGPLPGLLAEYSVLPERALARLPDRLDYRVGATLPIAALTAWHALFEAAPPLPPGATVLLEGTGGVALFGLQFARTAGLRTIITSSSDEKLDRARALGADHTINYRQYPQWSAEVHRLTAGRGVDLVLDVGGATTLPEAVASTALGGRIALVGFLGGQALSLQVPELLRRLVTLQALRVGSRAMFTRMLDAMTVSDRLPVVDRTFDFHDVAAAFSHLRAGSHFGKIVLTAPTP